MYCIYNMTGAIAMPLSGRMSGVGCEANNVVKWNSRLFHGNSAGACSFKGGSSVTANKISCSATRKQSFKSVISSVLKSFDARSKDNPFAISKTETQVFPYSFRSEFDALVKVLVESTSRKHSVHFEVLPSSCFSPNLVLIWCMFRSNPCDLIAPDSINEKNLRRTGKGHVFSTSFTQNLSGEQTAKLEFNSSQAPFFLSFTLGISSDSVNMGAEIRTHRKTKFCVPVGIARGSPVPLGVTHSIDGMVNFALYSRDAESVILCLYGDMSGESSLEIALDPYLNRTGDTWHISVPSLQNFAYYGYLCDGPEHSFDSSKVLFDPYARLLGAADGNSAFTSKPLGILKKEPSFDWGDDIHPNLPMEKLVVYRLNVEKFTEGASSQLPRHLAGSFAGVADKVEHLKRLGVNAILLEPIFTFDEKKGPYFPYNFFSPMNKHGPGSDGMLAITSLKQMVKDLHDNGIEVFLEVRFISASEGGDIEDEAATSDGIYESLYHDADAENSDAFRCNDHVIQRLVLDSLRYWVVTYRIDGFCFVDSSMLLRDANGFQLPRPPLLEAISFDPLLSKTKLIADCWSPEDLSYKQVQFPHWKRWAEMNPRFCTDVRDFLRGKGLLSSLATRLCGSGDIFSTSRGPAFSFNFIARNFGLPLVDLVSFGDEKISSELSWNCGEEGPTSSSSVLDLRLKQIRNFIFILFISLGVPVINMGDEYGLSTGGSPSYSKRGAFDWYELNSTFGVQTIEFIAFLSSMRARRNDLFQVKNYLKVENIMWRGSDGSPPNWDDPSCNFLAMLLKSSDEGDMFVAINSGDFSVNCALPQLPEGFAWSSLVDTALPYPGFFGKDGDHNDHQSSGLANYGLQAHSCVLFESKSSIVSSGASGSS